MTAPLFQETSFQDNSTSADYHDNSNVNETHEVEFYISKTVSTPRVNISCYPRCGGMHSKSTGWTSNFITGFIYPLLVVFILSISVILLRRYYYSPKQQKKDKEYLQSEKLCAHPFEDVLIVVNETQSSELMVIQPTTAVSN